MKLQNWIGIALLSAISTFAQGTIVFTGGTGVIMSDRGSGSGSRNPSYATGGSGSGAAVTGTASTIRNRSFEGSGYFNSSSDSVDTAFALQLGNGVDPRMASSFQGQTVPEPSTIALGIAGFALIAGALRRRSSQLPRD